MARRGLVQLIPNTDRCDEQAVGWYDLYDRYNEMRGTDALQHNRQRSSIYVAGEHHFLDDPQPAYYRPSFATDSAAMVMHYGLSSNVGVDLERCERNMSPVSMYDWNIESIHKPQTHVPDDLDSNKHTHWKKSITRKVARENGKLQITCGRSHSYPSAQSHNASRKAPSLMEEADKTSTADKINASTRSSEHVYSDKHHRGSRGNMETDMLHTKGKDNHRMGYSTFVEENDQLANVGRTFTRHHVSPTLQGAKRKQNRSRYKDNVSEQSGREWQQGLSEERDLHMDNNIDAANNVDTRKRKLSNIGDDINITEVNPMTKKSKVDALSNMNTDNSANNVYYNQFDSIIEDNDDFAALNGCGDETDPVFDVFSIPCMPIYAHSNQYSDISEPEDNITVEEPISSPNASPYSTISTVSTPSTVYGSWIIKEKLSDLDNGIKMSFIKSKCMEKEQVLKKDISNDQTKPSTSVEDGKKETMRKLFVKDHDCKNEKIKCKEPQLEVSDNVDATDDFTIKNDPAPSRFEIRNDLEIKRHDSDCKNQDRKDTKFVKRDLDVKDAGSKVSAKVITDEHITHQENNVEQQSKCDKVINISEIVRINRTCDSEDEEVDIEGLSDTSASGQQLSCTEMCVEHEDAEDPTQDDNEEDETQQVEEELQSQSNMNTNNVVDIVRRHGDGMDSNENPCDGSSIAEDVQKMHAEHECSIEESNTDYSEDDLEVEQQLQCEENQDVPFEMDGALLGNHNAENDVNDDNPIPKQITTAAIHEEHEDTPEKTNTFSSHTVSSPLDPMDKGEDNNCHHDVSIDSVHTEYSEDASLTDDENEDVEDYYNNRDGRADKSLVNTDDDDYKDKDDKYGSLSTDESENELIVSTDNHEVKGKEDYSCEDENGDDSVHTEASEDESPDNTDDEKYDNDDEKDDSVYRDDSGDESQVSNDENEDEEYCNKEKEDDGVHTEEPEDASLVNTDVDYNDEDKQDDSEYPDDSQDGLIGNANIVAKEDEADDEEEEEEEAFEFDWDIPYDDIGEQQDVGDTEVDDLHTQDHGTEEHSKYTMNDTNADVNSEGGQSSECDNNRESSHGYDHITDNESSLQYSHRYVSASEFDADVHGDHEHIEVGVKRGGKSDYDNEGTDADRLDDDTCNGLDLSLHPVQDEDSTFAPDGSDTGEDEQLTDLDTDAHSTAGENSTNPLSIADTCYESHAEESNADTVRHGVERIVADYRKVNEDTWSDETPMPDEEEESDNESATEEVQCQFCNQTFMGPNFLAYHQQMIHPYGDKVKCPHCERLYKNMNSLITHIRKIHRRRQTMTCIPCKKAYKEASGYIYHMKTIHNKGQVYECSYCLKPFFSKKHRNAHYRKRHLLVDKHPYKCKDCMKGYKDKKGYDYHMKSVHQTLDGQTTPGKDIICKQCEKPFYTKSALSAHVRFVHYNLRPHQCFECSKRFTTKSVLEQHRRTHTGEKLYECTICQKSFSTSTHMNMHIKFYHNDGNKENETTNCPQCQKRIKITSIRKHLKHCEKQAKEKEENDQKTTVECDICKESFHHKGSLRSHMAQEHGKEIYKCKFCEQTFISPGLRATHLRAEHPNELKFSCLMCGLKMFNIQSLRMHVKNKHSERVRAKCLACEKTFMSESSLAQHLKTHEGQGERKYQCNMCDMTLKCRKDLQVHVQAHKRTMPYICRYCEKGFTQKSNLKTHEKVVHEGILYGRKLAECELCGKKCKGEQELRHHMAMHDNVRDHVCVVCQMSFNTIGVLQAHKMEQNHYAADEVRPKECPYCPLMFHKQFSYDHHIAQVHLKIDYKCRCGTVLKDEVQLKHHLDLCKRKLKCTKCGTKAASKDLLFAHIKTHYSRDAIKPNTAVENKKYRFKCDKCEKAYPRKDSLDKHIKITHLMIKKYKCKICAKRFTMQCGLTAHMDWHNDVKRYECGFCHKRFRQSAHLSTHVKTWHVENRPYRCELCDYSSVTKRNLEIHMNNHTGEKPFKCKKCEKAYSSPNGLSCHIKSVHEKDWHFSCKICDAKFPIKGSLTAHMRSHSDARLFVCKYCNKDYKGRSGLQSHIETQHEGLPFAMYRRKPEKVNG